MKIDAVKEEKLMDERFEGWARASIREIIGETIYCDFEGIPHGTV